MSDEAKLLHDLAERLENFPADGKLPWDFVTDRLIAAGFVVKKHTDKQCSACGASKPDYYYYHRTEGGRLFLAAMKERANVG